MKKVENHVAKGEIACFQKSSVVEASERVNGAKNLLTQTNFSKPLNLFGHEIYSNQATSDFVL